MCDMLLLMRHDSQRRLARSQFRRGLKRNGRIVGAIDIAAVGASLAGLGVEFGFVRRRSRTDLTCSTTMR